MGEIVNGTAQRDGVEEAALRDRLYQEIGQLEVELGWLKKSMSCSLEQRRQAPPGAGASHTAKRPFRRSVNGVQRTFDRRGARDCEARSPPPCSF